MSSEEVDNELNVIDMTPYSLLPVCSSIENIPEMSTFVISSSITDLNFSIGYVLPHMHNHAKPPHSYSPDATGRKNEYPIVHYIYTHRLFKPWDAFLYRMYH